MRLEIPEGKNLPKTVERAIAQARKQRVEILVMRSFTAHGVSRQKPILHISPKGDVSEMLVPALRAMVGEHAVEQVLREGHIESPAARLLEAHQRVLKDLEKGKARRVA